MLLLLCASCAKQQSSSTTEVSCAFSADSAYTYIAQQVAFGSRVPGTLAHEKCGDWLVTQLAGYGAQVKNQYATMTNYAGDEQPIRNILAYFEGETSNAILLCAHWDCRPWSDEEEAYENRFEPVMGANDGASGVGVILEMVRQLSIRKSKGEFIPTVQVVFFDCEDMGTPAHFTGSQRDHTWCLGSQYWAQEYKHSTLNSQLSYTSSASDRSSEGEIRTLNSQQHDPNPPSSLSRYCTRRSHGVLAAWSNERLAQEIAFGLCVGGDGGCVGMVAAYSKFGDGRATGWSVMATCGGRICVGYSLSTLT